MYPLHQMVSWMLSFSWLYPIHGLLSITIRIGNILHSSFIYGTIRKDCLKGQSVQFSSFRLLSHVRLFATPWIAARQPSLSITSSQSSLKLMSIESVMPSCHPAISSPVVPFSSCPQSLPASESFPMSQLVAWGGQSIGLSALASVLPKNTQNWSP